MYVLSLAVIQEKLKSKVSREEGPRAEQKLQGTERKVT